MARTFSGRRSFVSNPNPSVEVPSEPIERSLERNFPMYRNVENEPLDISDNPLENEPIIDRSGHSVETPPPNYFARRNTTPQESFEASQNFESALSFNPISNPLGDPFEQRTPDMNKVNSEMAIIKNEMGRLREEQRIIDKGKIPTEYDLLAKSEKYRFLRERLDQLQQMDSDYKSDSVFPAFTQSQTINPVRTAQRSFSRITNESPFESVSTFEPVKTSPMSTGGRVMGTPLENSMFDPNFKVADVFKTSTLGTELELVAKGMKAGYARTPTGATVGLRSNGQQLGKEETEQVQGIYNYQKTIMKQNQRQLDYFKDLTEGKIGLASVLLNPRTTQSHEGKDSRNLETFLSERGYDLDKPFEIPDSIFKPEKQQTARAQARKGSNMGTLESNPYFRIEDTNRKNLFMKYEVEETLDTLAAYSEIQDSPLNQPRPQLKPRQNILMGQVHSPLELEAGQFVKGSQTVFQEYYDTFDSARKFFAGEYDQSENNYVTSTLTDLLHSTGSSLETSFKQNKPLWETMSSEYSSFIEKQKGKTGSRIAGELVTEGGIFLATMGIGAGIGLAVKGFKGVSKFFSPSLEPFKPTFKPTNLRPRPPEDIFKLDTAIGMESKGIGLGKGVSKLGDKTKKNVESAVKGDKSIVDNFNKAVNDMQKKSARRFWRSFEEPRIEKGDRLIGSKGLQQIQKQKPVQKTKQQTKQETKQMTEAQKGNLQYSQQLQKNLLKKKQKNPFAFPTFALKDMNAQKLRQTLKLESVKPVKKQTPLRPKPVKVMQKQESTKPKQRVMSSLIAPLPPFTQPITNPIYPFFTSGGSARKKQQSKKKGRKKTITWFVPDSPFGFEYWGKKGGSQLGVGYK